MNDEGLSSNERAEQAYLGTVRAIRAISGAGTFDAEVSENIALGQNILHDEIGYYGAWSGSGYSFDKATQDRLLAHSRQDIAASYAMAKSAFREAHFARRTSTRAVWLLVASLAANLAILATLWW